MAAYKDEQRGTWYVSFLCHDTKIPPIVSVGRYHV